jgi:hypothetical protein
MINRLRLEEKVSDPPTFPDLICSIRKEESKRTERRLRHRKPARAHAATVRPEGPSDEMLLLQQRLADLEGTCNPAKTEPQVQAASQMTLTEETEAQPEQSSELVQLQQRVARIEKRFSTVRSRNVFCYRCGQDGHVATDCQNAPNKKLVQETAEARKKRRQNALN